MAHFTIDANGRMLAQSTVTSNDYIMKIIDENEERCDTGMTTSAYEKNSNQNNGGT